MLTTPDYLGRDWGGERDVQRQREGSPRNMKKGIIRYEIIFLRPSRGNSLPLLSWSGGPGQ